MRQTDLELYRWKWHNEVYLQFKRVQQAKSQLRPLTYWKEYGAFTSVLPRQTGKTTMLGEIAKHYMFSEGEQVVVIAPTVAMANSFSIKTNLGGSFMWSINSWLAQPKAQVTAAITSKHLLVDEFTQIPEVALGILLDHKWKSVTMVSSL